jgi:hypothetical protein
MSDTSDFSLRFSADSAIMSKEPYRIALRGPWEFEPVATTDPGSEMMTEGKAASFPSGRARFPAGWTELFGEFRGKMRFRRRFHRPTNLDPHERVWLVLEAVGGTGRIEINGCSLGTVAHSTVPQRFDVTDFLIGNDDLVIELAWHGSTTGSEPGGLYAPVILEIVQQPTTDRSGH